MKTNITILTTVALLVAFSLNAQVAINTDGTSPDASTMLDIQSTNRGTSFPNLNIANMSTAAPVTSPKTGLIAYNTNATTGPGLVMWTGSRWVMFELQGTCWLLTGNAGTTVGTNFLGTTDAEPLAIYTNDTERMRILDNGQVIVNNGYTAPGSDNKFEVRADATYNDAVNGYSSAGYGVYGNSGSSYAVYGYSEGSTSVRAQNGSTTGTGLLATGNDVSGANISGGSGASIRGSKYGVYAKALNTSDGTGIGSVGNGYSTLSYLTSGSGGAFSGYHGVYGKGRDSGAGIGVIGVGNDSIKFHYISGGNGGAFSGAKAGVYGFGSDATGGTGVVGVGNQGSAYYSLPGGSGGAFTGDVCGVYGVAHSTSGDRYGGYFYANDDPPPPPQNGPSYAYVGAFIGGTRYKINGNGSNGSILKDVNGELVTITCPEAPEILLQDYGIGQLVNGKAHINIDPNLAININVSPEHPLKVFVTLEGDCKGVYVSNKSAEGFDVIELQGGASNVTFSWQIVATRADEYEGGKMVSNNSRRFQPAPGPLEEAMLKKTGQTSIDRKVMTGKTLEAKEIMVQEKAEE